jgi:hypothetical protein
VGPTVEIFDDSLCRNSFLCWVSQQSPLYYTILHAYEQQQEEEEEQEEEEQQQQ